MRPTCYFTMLGLLLAVRVYAQPTTRSAQEEMSTPKGTLYYGDRVLERQGVDQELTLYHAVGERQETMARAMARADVAVGRLESVVQNKFGTAASADVVHALDGKTRADIDTAKEQIDREKANIVWDTDNDQPVPMIQVDGIWKVSVAGVIQGMDDDGLTALRTANEKLARAAEDLAAQVSTGKIRKAQGVVEAAKKILADITPTTDK